jgi:hypothetical protein
VAENYGGPVWHASARGATQRESLRIARLGLQGVGAATLGEWTDTVGMGRGIVHVQRRLTDEEREAHAVPEPYDIRGTDEERDRLRVTLEELPENERRQIATMYAKALA